MPRRDHERHLPPVRNKGFWGWVEKQALLLQHDPEYRALAFRIAWWVSTAVVAFGLVIIALGLLGGADAQGDAAAEPRVASYDALDVIVRHVPGGSTTWSVVQAGTLHVAGEFPVPADVADVWLPASARNLQVRVVGENFTFSHFTLLEDGRGRVHWNGSRGHAFDQPERVIVSFTLPEDPAAFRAPASVSALTLTLALPEGRSPPSGAEWARVPGDAHAWRFTDAGVPAGERVPVAPTPPPASVATLGVLVAFAALALVAGGAWARARAPLVDPDVELKLVDHLRELQSRIVVVVAFFVVYAVAFFTLGFQSVTLGGLTVPVPSVDVTESVAARAFQSIAAWFVPAGVNLVVVRPVDAALTQLLVSFFLALVTVSPLAAWQTAAFFGPALEPNEEKLILRLVPLGVGLFLVGVVFSALVMVPVTMRVLYGYAGAIGATPLLAVNDLVSFSVVLLTVFGVAFELPLVMAALTRLGVVRAATWGKYWRHAVVGIFIFSGVVTPDPTWVSQILLALPLTALFFGGVAAARLMEKRTTRA